MLAEGVPTKNADATKSATTSFTDSLDGANEPNAVALQRNGTDHARVLRRDGHTVTVPSKLGTMTANADAPLRAARNPIDALYG